MLWKFLAVWLGASVVFAAAWTLIQARLDKRRIASLQEALRTLEDRKYDGPQIFWTYREGGDE